LKGFRFVSNSGRRERNHDMGRRLKKYLFAFIGLVLLSVGGFFLYGMIGQKGTNQNFRVVKLERGDIRSVVTATGTINPVITVLVGSQVSGTIKALYADFNSSVKEGQVIAQIDPAIFEAQVEQGRANVMNAQANLINAQANLKNNQANLDKAEVAVLDTKRTLERNRELVGRKVVAQAVFDTAQANYDSAAAQRDSARAQMETAKAQIEGAKAQIEQAKAALRMSETNLRYATIRSPVNGIVISRNVDVGQTVAASLQAPTLFTIAKDLTRMQVDANVSEADIGRLAKGQDATFTVDAYPERTFRGRIAEIRNAPITVQNVVTYDVVIEVGNKDFKLKPGMTANVTILVEHKEGILKISNAALRFRPENARKEDSKKEDRKKEGSQPTRRTSLERLTEGLNLTPEQQSKVEAVLNSLQQEIKEIRGKSKGEEARARIQELIGQKITGLLTAEQKKKLNELNQSPPSDEKRRGRVWILTPERKPVPVSVILGITDGAFSEVSDGDLKEGVEVIVEDTSKKTPSKNATPTPFGRGMGR
jgi:HlyD family secretion protein